MAPVIPPNPYSPEIPEYYQRRETDATPMEPLPPPPVVPPFIAAPKLPPHGILFPGMYDRRPVCVVRSSVAELVTPEWDYLFYRMWQDGGGWSLKR